MNCGLAGVDDKAFDPPAGGKCPALCKQVFLPPGRARQLLRAGAMAVGLIGAAGASAGAAPVLVDDATPAGVRAFFTGAGKHVLTFLGYSGAGYEDQARMLAEAQAVLAGFDPARTLVNIGATADGIGAVYELAKRRGFATTGIVSSVAKADGVALSPWVDRVFYVQDESWGGLIPGTEILAPTSAAMVDASDTLVAIGGGEVARDEWLAARRAGKAPRFIAADMDHRLAREAAVRKGRPAPTDFRGALAAVLAAE